MARTVSQIYSVEEFGTGTPITPVRVDLGVDTTAFALSISLFASAANGENKPFLGKFYFATSAFDTIGATEAPVELGRDSVELELIVPTLAEVRKTRETEFYPAKDYLFIWLEEPTVLTGIALDVKLTEI